MGTLEGDVWISFPPLLHSGFISRSKYKWTPQRGLFRTKKTWNQTNNDIAFTFGKADVISYGIVPYFFSFFTTRRWTLKSKKKKIVYSNKPPRFTRSWLANLRVRSKTSLEEFKQLRLRKASLMEGSMWGLGKARHCVLKDTDSWGDLITQVVDSTLPRNAAAQYHSKVFEGLYSLYCDPI